MAYFLSQLQVVLPVLGVNAVRVRPTKPSPSTTAEVTESPIFRLQNAKLGVDARVKSRS